METKRLRLGDVEQILRAAGWPAEMIDRLELRPRKHVVSRVVDTKDPSDRSDLDDGGIVIRNS